ncbi:MAG: hypothetical protein ACI39R_05775 [Lachnospiraceae bacterium]
MLKSIIWADKPPVREALMPNFFIDLNLDKIVYKINSLRKYYDIKKLFYMLSDSRETMEMRRRIYADIKKPEVFDAFCRFSDRMKEARDYLAGSDEIDFMPQKSVLFVTAAERYDQAIKLLENINSAESPEICFAVSETQKYVNTDEYRLFAEQTEKLYSETESFFYRLTLNRDTFTVRCQQSENNYFDKIKRAFPDAVDTGFESPFKSRSTLSHIETESYAAIAKAHPDCIKNCESFMNTYKNSFLQEFFDLEFELQLYLSFLLFERYMEDNGFHFTSPVTAKCFDVNGVYDAALALTLFNHERPVIDNDVFMREEEHFLIVTGPNQGGKTTFARSMGQLVYFSLMGLSVPAMKAAVPYFDGILTHFSVEESTETGQGKLKEELTRLAPMMRGDDKNCFIILNELFTTAATYDASVMGRRVIRHFTENGCTGIYVTHIKELSEGEGVVSLVAVCDENDYHKRLYKMIRRPADGIGYAGTLVEKYGLTYDMLIENFKEKQLLCPEKEADNH